MAPDPPRETKVSDFLWPHVTMSIIQTGDVTMAARGADRIARGQGNASIANYVRKHYPYIVTESAEFYAEEHKQQAARAREAKRQRHVDAIMEKMAGLQAELAALQPPEPVTVVEREFAVA
jgi:hypothetical protein